MLLRLFLILGLLCWKLAAAVVAQDTAALFPAPLDGDRWGYIDPTGAVAIPGEYDAVHPFVDGRARVRKNDRVYYIDRTGDVVGAKYDDGYNYSGGFARVVRTEQRRRAIAYVNRAGALVTPFEYRQATGFGGGVAAVRDESPLQQRWSLIDSSGSAVGRSFLQAAQPSEGLVPVRFYSTFLFFRVPQKWGYVDLGGEVAIDGQYDLAFRFSEGLAAVVLDEQVGYIDRQGGWRIDPQFRIGRSFQDGRALVRSADGWHFIDATGRALGPARYEAALDFSDGYAAVQQQGRWGFINADGAWAFDQRFDFVQPFREGLAYVRDGEQEGYIDRTGAFVWTRGE